MLYFMKFGTFSGCFHADQSVACYLVRIMTCEVQFSQKINKYRCVQRVGKEDFSELVRMPLYFEMP